jgi:hypothetical protein
MEAVRSRLIFMFVALLFASSLAALQQTGSIAGCIVDAMRQPLPGVAVAATGESR